MTNVYICDKIKKLNFYNKKNTNKKKKNIIKRSEN